MSQAISPVRRPYSPSQASSSAIATYSDDDDDDYDALSLPFPTPLPRADFLATSFDPSLYLSSLGPRPQTLEDLRGDLRQRSQLLRQELLELVNSRYEDFLGLGSSVAGGGERVAEVRVGLMGLRREIEGVRSAVEAREQEVLGLIHERKRVAREREWGRSAVQFWEGIGKLEREIGIQAPKRRQSSVVKDKRRSSDISKWDYQAPMQPNGVIDEDLSDDNDENDDSDDYDDDDSYEGLALEEAAMLSRLSRRVDDFTTLEALAMRLGPGHAFISTQRHRMLKLRNTLLVDLGVILKAATSQSRQSAGPTLKVLALYRRLGASKDAVDVLRRLPKQ